MGGESMENGSNEISRRSFLMKSTAAGAAATAFTIIRPELVRGAIGDSKYTGVADKVKVDPDHHFVGFDAYKKVLASDIDVVLLATRPGYRPEHFVAAVEAKKHIFAEKPFGTDPVGVRKVMAASKKAEELKLTV